MGLLERGRRRALRELHDGEVVVASLTGIEADGRRRRFVLVTDRRVLVGSARGDGPVELDLDDLVASFETSGGLLTLRRDGTEVVLRDVDEVPARALVGVIAQHRRGGQGQARSTPPGVRVIRDVAGDAG